MKQDLTIGLICPGGGIKNPEIEMAKYAPADIKLLTRQIPLAKIDPQVLSDFGDMADDAAKDLAAQGADLVVFNCTSGSFIRGLGYDLEIIRRLEKATGLPAITTTTAVVAALKSVGGTHLTMVTPYPDSVNEVEIRFLEESGFHLVSSKGLGIVQMNLVAKVPFDQLYALIRDTDRPQSNCIFISCAGLRVLDYIRGLESNFQKSVITSNQATLWMALRTLGRSDRLIPGSLFDH